MGDVNLIYIGCVAISSSLAVAVASSVPIKDCRMADVTVLPVALPIDASFFFPR